MIFEVVWTRSEYLTVEFAQTIVRRQIIGTARVKAIIQCWSEGELYIRNDEYKKLNHFKSKINNNEKVSERQETESGDCREQY